MLTLVAAITLCAGTAHSDDPSLRAALGFVAPARTITAFNSLPPIVLSQDDALLLWSADTGSFQLFLAGQPVLDLVTGVDKRGWPSFYGAWTESGEPLIQGSVLGGRHAMEWFVELSRPARRPHLYYVGSVDDPPGDYPQVCDCSDRVNFCTTEECNDQKICRQTTDKTCKWFNSDQGGGGGNG